MRRGERRTIALSADRPTAVRACVVIAALVFACAVAIAGEPQRPDWMAAPLVSSSGEAFSLEDFEGKLVLVNFMFTSCGGICPMQTASLRQVMATLDPAEMDELVFLSVSIDPARDTPDVLAAYKSNYKIDTDRWVFCTGSETSVETLTTAFGTLGDDGDPLNHRGRYYLLDRKGALLLSYNSGTTNVDRLSRDLKSAVQHLERP